MSKIREKESLECVRMHIWASKTQKLPGPLSGPWTPAAECSLRSHDSASLCRQLSASEAGAPPLTKSWIRTWAVLSKVLWNDFPCRVCWHLRNDFICRGFACLLKFWVLEISWIRLLFTSCIFVAKQKLCVCTFLELFCGNILAWSGKFRTPYLLPYLCPQYFRLYSQV